MTNAKPEDSLLTLLRTMRDDGIWPGTAQLAHAWAMADGEPDDRPKRIVSLRVRAIDGWVINRPRGATMADALFADLEATVADLRQRLAVALLRGDDA